jgi:hypothetical protein
MPTYTSAKAQSLAAEIQDDLARRGYTAVASVSAVSGFEGSPLLTIGTPGAGAQAVVIRIARQESLALDSVGQSIGFTPHIAQVAYEKVSGNAGACLLYVPLLVDVLGSLMVRGLHLEMYGEANGSTASEADMVVAKLAKDWHPDLKWKAMSGQ